MSSACTAACWEIPSCNVCGRPKTPHGRSVPLAASAGYCDWECRGYNLDPKPGHYWPEEKAEMDGAAA